MEQACKICGNTVGNQLHTAREMAFGLREEFPYLECVSCGCLQILHIPPDMAKYYPRNYYSFQEHGWLKTFVRHQWSAYAFSGRNPLGRALSAFFVPNGAMQAVRRSGVTKSARILDVGCGSGRLLLDLAWLGFQNLTGADPFISADLSYPNGVRVLKKNIAELPTRFDLIMLHHSYEHMDRPAEVMQHIARLLTPGGQAIVRIPVASSYAWKHYGVSWINLDAPRHFYLHTFKSIDLLAQRAGLRVREVVHEGNDEQFWGSEQFARNIPSNDPRSLGSSALKRLAHWRQIRTWKAKSRDLDRQGQADLVCFHLVPLA